MDLAILHAIWFDCPDLPDTAHKLLLAIAYHGNPCWPAVGRLATMIRRSERQTQYLLRQLEQEGYISVEKGRGRSKSSTYTIKVQPGLRPLEKRCNLGFAEKVQPGLHPNSYREQKKEKESERDKKEGQKAIEASSKGLQLLTRGSLAYQHANGTSSPP